MLDLATETLTSAGDGFAGVFDATGHLPFALGRSLLRPGGSYVSSDLGRGAQNLLLAAIGPLARGLGHRHVRFPLPHADAAVAAELVGTLGSGALRPVVDRTYDVEQLREAYAYVDSGRKVGSVVIRMPAARPQDS